MNRVADCLSQYYESDGLDDHHPDHNFMSADAKLNPDGELIPVQWYAEMCTTVTRWSICLAKKAKQQVLDSSVAATPTISRSVGKVQSQTDWDPVSTGPNPVVPVPVWDFPKNTGPLGLRSGQFHIA